MCTWMHKFSCACMCELCWSRACICTYFNNHMLICLFALMITCFYVHTFWCSLASMSICFDGHTLLCSHALTIICSHIYMLYREHVHFPISLNAHMLKQCFDCMLLCSHALLVTCFYVYIPWWWNASMSTCFDDNMHTFLSAFKLICLDALMITYSCIEIHWLLHAYMHWYSHVCYPHTFAHSWMMKCLLVQRLKWSCRWTFVPLNALTIVLECWGDWEVRSICTWLLKFSYAWMLLCEQASSHDHMVICSHALLITHSYLLLLWW